jgi:hypothetical protein
MPPVLLARPSRTQARAWTAQPAKSIVTPVRRSEKRPSGIATNSGMSANEAATRPISRGLLPSASSRYDVIGRDVDGSLRRRYRNQRGREAAGHPLVTAA